MIDMLVCFWWIMKWLIKKQGNWKAFVFVYTLFFFFWEAAPSAAYVLLTAARPAHRHTDSLPLACQEGPLMKNVLCLNKDANRQSSVVISHICSVAI